MQKQVSDFQLFITKNGLLKKNVAKYLGISNTWVTQICKNKATLSDVSLFKILSNKEGWDVSMLAHLADEKTLASIPGVSIGSGNINSGGDQNVFSFDEQLLHLHEGYLDLLKKKDEQMDRLIAIIEKQS